MKFIRKIYREKDIKNIQEKLDMLGNTKWNAIKFMNYRLLSTIIFAFFIIVFTKIGYIFMVFLVGLYYFLFYYVFITRQINFFKI